MAISTKILILMRAPGGRDAVSFQTALAASCQKGDSAFTGAKQISLCRIDTAPDGLPRRPDDALDPRPPYDAVIRAVFDDSQTAARAFDALSGQGQLPRAEIAHWFLVTEIPVLDRLPSGQQPALKTLALIVFHDDLPDSAARRSWAQHAKLASIIHVGAGRYVRNWVEKRGAGSPPVRGIVEIDFATVPDLVERYFGVPDGMERVIQDTGHFVQHATRLYMREEILRA
jgi:hypothetical protein